MSSSNTTINTLNSQTQRKTRIVRSRDERSHIVSDDKIRYVYEVRVEAQVDLVWAFAAIHNDGYSYTPQCTPDGRIIFSTICSIEQIRKLWNTLNKDLHVMIETLNYTDDYDGDRYFIKYWDAKKKDDDHAYISDEE